MPSSRAAVLASIISRWSTGCAAAKHSAVVLLAGSGVAIAAVCPGLDLGAKNDHICYTCRVGQGRRDWTEQELLLTLSLYRQLPFGQLDARNSAVQKLAGTLGRTPSAVALKLVNFASFDPTLRARGVRGMGNTSKLDREVWDRFATRWDRLASALPDEVDAALVAEQDGLRVTQVERLQRVRVGQDFFRNAVLAAYDMRCCITGIGTRPLLRASHIIPWSTSEAHRLDPANGLCLNALHDAAFDRGLLTFDENLCIRLSPRLASTMPPETFESFFAGYAGSMLRLPHRSQPNPEFLAFHRADIYLAT